MKRAVSAVRRLLPFIAPYKRYFIWGSVFTLLSVACSLTGPILVGRAIDVMVVGAVDFAALTKYFYLLLCVYVGSALFQWIGSYCSNTLTQLVVKDLRDAIDEKLQSVPFSYLDRVSHGDLISRMVNDTEKVGDGILHSYNHLIQGLATILVTIVCMFTLDWRIALAIVVVSPLSIVTSYFIAKHAQKMFDRQQAKLGELNGYTEEHVGNQKVVKAFGYEDKATKEFDAINDSLQKDMTSAHFISALTNPTTRAVNNIVYITAAALGVVLKCSIGHIGSFLMYANQYTKPFNDVTTIITDLQNALSAAERVTELLETAQEPPDSENAADLENVAGNISFENVSFSYSPEVPLITCFNLFAESGKRIAIVGPTGSGKTTLVNLLMRFYDVTGGAVKVDGVDVRTVRRRDLRDNFGMVLQESWLKADTIRNNIAYGNKDATDEQIIEVAKSCYCHDFVSSMIDGYDTVLTGGGENISQGQRQLLCLARVMLSEPKMLILDEATSNIDARREMYIQATFDKIMQGRTSFVVAHRLSTIKSADLILVLKDGDVIEQGNHEELMEQRGFYYDLYNSQFVDPSAV